jgi:hypothetical protein
MGYAYADMHRWSGIQAWAAVGGSALGAALTTAAVLLVIVGTAIATMYVVKGIAIVTWWLTVKMFWLTIIVGGVTAAGWAITMASCRWLGVCRFFFAT